VFSISEYEWLQVSMIAGLWETLTIAQILSLSYLHNVTMMILRTQYLRNLKKKLGHRNYHQDRLKPVSPEDNQNRRYRHP
jgi:hypothetical protein